MSTSPRDFLQHILEECNYITGASKGLPRDRFVEDETLKRAMTRSIEIIGEAVKKLDEEFRAKYPGIEWKKLAGARDRIIHHYSGIDYDIIWEIVEEKVPQLKDYIEEIISEQ